MNALCPLCTAWLKERLPDGPLEGPVAEAEYNQLHEVHRGYVRRAVYALEDAGLEVNAASVAGASARIARMDLDEFDAKRRAADARN